MVFSSSSLGGHELILWPHSEPSIVPTLQGCILQHYNRLQLIWHKILTLTITRS